MELQHVNVKVFVDGDLPLDPQLFIEVFHRWIREAVFPELLIDVADYRHVPQGPGVMLIGHEADYSMDNSDGRWGLLYNRKAALAGSNADRLGQALTSASKACGLLQSEFAEQGLKFSGRELELIFNDRALTPNTAETFAACEGELKAFLSAALGHDDFTLQHDDDPRKRFSVRLAAGKPFDPAALAG